MASYLLPAGYAFVAYILIWTTGLGSVPSAQFLSDSVTAVGIRNTFVVDSIFEGPVAGIGASSPR